MLFLEEPLLRLLYRPTLFRHSSLIQLFLFAISYHNLYKTPLNILGKVVSLKFPCSLFTVLLKLKHAF